MRIFEFLNIVFQIIDNGMDSWRSDSIGKGGVWSSAQETDMREGRVRIQVNMHI